MLDLAPDLGETLTPKWSSAGFFPRMASSWAVNGAENIYMKYNLRSFLKTVQVS